MDGHKQEFIQITTLGLQAMFKERSGLVVTPIVGYLRDEKGELQAAIIGDYGKVVPAASLKTFYGVRWEARTESGVSGNSIFEKVFGSKL